MATPIKKLSILRRNGREQADFGQEILIILIIKGVGDIQNSIMMPSLRARARVRVYRLLMDVWFPVE